MKLKNDSCFKKLSDKTIKEVFNCTQNCNKDDIPDYLFSVFNNSFNRGEIKENDIFRLCFKALNDFYHKKIKNF